jgi:hypothetical protein
MDSYVDHPFSKDVCAVSNQDLLRAFVGGIPFRFVENRFSRSFLNRLKTTFNLIKTKSLNFVQSFFDLQR